MTSIKRIILDVLKPHKPSIIELSKRLSSIDVVSGVNISLEEVDAVVHSIDGVSAGMKMIEEVNTSQDR